MLVSSLYKIGWDAITTWLETYLTINLSQGKYLGLANNPQVQTLMAGGNKQQWIMIFMYCT